MPNDVQERTKIVVGFDGSEGSHPALRWAAAEAALRGVPLSIVRAWQPGEFGTDSEVAEIAQTHLDKEVGDLLRDAGPVTWQATAVHGPAARVLIEQSKGGQMLVVGSRGHGGFTGLLLGSVGHQVSTHTGAPVVVIVKS